jgi:hypothetical protein
MRQKASNLSNMKKIKNKKSHIKNLENINDLCKEIVFLERIVPDDD